MGRVRDCSGGQAWGGSAENSCCASKPKPLAGSCSETYGSWVSLPCTYSPCFASRCRVQFIAASLCEAKYYSCNASYACKLAISIGVQVGLQRCPLMWTKQTQDYSVSI